MVNLGIGTASLAAFLGYAVVFLGIVFLMVIISIMGNCMKKSAANKAPQPNNVNLGNVSAPKGIDPKKVAVIMAAVAEMEKEA